MIQLCFDKNYPEKHVTGSNAKMLSKEMATTLGGRFFIYDAYAKKHKEWKCLLITYDEEGMEEGIEVLLIWKWLMEG